MKYEEAKIIAEKIKKEVKIDKISFKTYIVGSVARQEENIKDIDFLIVTTSFIDNILNKIYFTKESGIIVTEVISCGERRCSVRLSVQQKDTTYRVKVDFFYALKCNLPFALLHHIGPRIYNIRLRNKAKTMGYILNQYGIFNRDNERRVNHNFKNESDIQKFLDVTIRPPIRRR